MSVIYNCLTQGVLCAKKTMISLSVSTFSLVLVVVTLQVVKSTSSGPNYLNVLASRLSRGSGDATYHHWHTTCFRVCRLADLQRAVGYACELDPYRENRSRRSINSTMLLHHRRNQRRISIQKPLTKKENDHPVFLSKLRAASFLKTRRSRSVPDSNSNPNILDECCISKSCAWEEYGEYCHSHTRSRPPARSSVCAS